jgi:hypothetical protein
VRGLPRTIGTTLNVILPTTLADPRNRFARPLYARC